MAGPPNRAALVTGASAGIGRATARHLALGGMTVVVTARRAERLATLVDEIKAADGHAIAVAADASDETDIDRLWQEATDAAGPISCVVANAGRGLQGGVTTSDESAWREMVQLNVVGTMHLMRLASDAMVGVSGPRDIVVIGSVVGANVSPFSAVYGATKFAIGSAAESLRRDVGPRGVRVSVIKPGIVATEFQDVAGYDEETFGKVVRKFGQPLTGDDVARSIRFVVEQPEGVHVNDLMLRPTGQDYP